MRQIADSGYNAGFGAKKNFASLDLTTLGPNVIGFATMAAGVAGLINKTAGSPAVSAVTICLGILTFYLNVQKRDLKKWAESGSKLTDISQKLGLLYHRVKASGTGVDLAPFVTELQDLRSQYLAVAVPQQVNFSGWYAHLKFFGEAQISWMDEQLKFRLFRDKIPASFTLTVVLLLLGCLGYGLANCSWNLF